MATPGSPGIIDAVSKLETKAKIALHANRGDDGLAVEHMDTQVQLMVCGNPIQIGVLMNLFSRDVEPQARP